MAQNHNRSLSAFATSKHGVTSVEYALITAVFFITAVGSFTTLGAQISSTLRTIGNDLVSTASVSSSATSGSTGTSGGSTSTSGGTTEGSGTDNDAG